MTDGITVNEPDLLLDGDEQAMLPLADGGGGRPVTDTYTVATWTEAPYTSNDRINEAARRGDRR